MPFGNQRTPPPQPETAYFSDCVTFGMHAYRTENEDCSVCYMDDARGICKMVVDQNGQFCDFPIIITEDFWKTELQDSGALKNQIRFRTSFEKMNGGFVVLWTIQPDGRYWEDSDGYGGTPDREIILYSFLDTNGNICAPFRIYRLGAETFYVSQETQPLPITPQAQTAEEKVIAEGVKKNTKIFKEIMWIATILSNAAMLFVISFLSGEYDTYYGKRNPYGSIFEYMLEDILWIFLIIMAALSLILIALAILPHRQIQKSCVTLTDRRVFGISTFGKEFDIAMDALESVNCSKGKLTLIANNQKAVLWFLKNADEIARMATDAIEKSCW